MGKPTTTVPAAPAATPTPATPPSPEAAVIPTPAVAAGQAEELSELKQQVAALQAHIASLSAPAPAQADRFAPPTVDEMYPALADKAREPKVVVTCVARRGVSTGVGHYLRAGETSPAIPKSIADELIESGAAVKGEHAPKDMAARHARETAEEAENFQLLPEQAG